ETALRIEQERQAWDDIMSLQARSDEMNQDFEMPDGLDEEELKRSAQAYRDILDPMQSVYREMSMIATLEMKGLLDPDEAAELIKNLETVTKTGKNEFDELKRAIEGFGDSAAETFVDLAFTGKA